MTPIADPHVRALFDELIAEPRLLGADFQPVRRLDDDLLVGYRASGRGQRGTELADASSLRSGAQALGVVRRLDWEYRCLTLAVAAAAGVDVEVHITPEPETFDTLCPPRLAVAFSRSRRQLDLVAELQAGAFADPSALRTAAEDFRDWGWRIVVADVADMPEAMDSIGWLRPAYVQVDLALPARNPDAPAASVRRLLEHAGAVGAQIMAVGVDEPADRLRAQRLGATVGRGRLLGGPRPLP